MLNSDLFKFPFISEVWGSFSDVLALIVTTIGTLYVVQSFRAQRKINEEQAKINRLAMEKDRREIRPFFKIATVSRSDIRCTVTIDLTNADAFSLKVNPATKTIYDVKNSLGYAFEWQIGKKIDFDIQPKSGIFKEVVGMVMLVGVAKIRFRDEDGRSYEQSLSLTSSGNEPEITLPMLIDNYDPEDED